jgi:ABC-type oligopeptide transport system substrate-binding subunit
MKKIFAIFVMAFAMALVLIYTSCGNRQAKTETEVAADSTAVEVVDSTATAVDTVAVETPAEAVAE